MHILLATPTYGGLPASYMAAVMKLQAWLPAQGVQVRVVMNAMAEVARSRNTLATHFWENPELTHLLFVDSDMSFEPEVVGALIRANKPLVGGVYPKRKIDFARLVDAARRYDDLGSVLAAAYDWVVVPGRESAEVNDGLCRVDGVGMGLCLIAREVFAGMLDTGRVSQDRVEAVTAMHAGPALGFFDPIPSEQGFVPEDLAFCRRWREWCGGEVWAVLDQEIGHVGEFTYRGRCIDALAPVAHRD